MNKLWHLNAGGDGSAAVLSRNRKIRYWQNVFFAQQQRLERLVSKSLRTSLAIIAAAVAAAVAMTTRKPNFDGLRLR